MSPENKDSFISSFSICMLIINLFNFTCLIVLAWTSYAMLNKKDKREYHCLVHNLREKAFRLSPLCVIVTCFFHTFLYQIEEIFKETSLTSFSSYQAGFSKFKVLFSVFSRESRLSLWCFLMIIHSLTTSWFQSPSTFLRIYSRSSVSYIKTCVNILILCKKLP